MIKFGAEKLGLTEIIATTALENIASHRVLLKAGMCETEVRAEVDGFCTKVFRWEAFRSG